MRIKIGIPSGEKQRLFLDHFNSTLRARSSASSGTAMIRDDGTFESSTINVHTIGDEQVILTWTVTKSSDGMLQHISVNSDDPSKDEAIWKDTANDIVKSARTAALAEKKSRFFQRRLVYYVGTQLDGEYWLPGFRFAPAYPNDTDPYLIHAERPVFIDMNIDAIDLQNAISIAQERARRYAARMSLLLNVGLYQADHVHRWVILHGQDNIPSNTKQKNIRLQLGYIPKENADRMPEKGKLCQLGRYTGSLDSLSRVGSKLLSLPPEIQNILRGLDKASPSIGDAFDRCARLYQVAAVVGHQFPSLGLAYRIAAVDALTNKGQSVHDFVRKNTKTNQERDQLLNYLWSFARCAHFHAGEFPMGEYSILPESAPLIDDTTVKRINVQMAGYELTREAIITWLGKNVPELEPHSQSDEID